MQNVFILHAFNEIEISTEVGISKILDTREKTDLTNG
jgi:hypothetical protein